MFIVENANSGPRMKPPTPDYVPKLIAGRIVNVPVKKKEVESESAEEDKAAASSVPKNKAGGDGLGDSFEVKRPTFNLTRR